MTQPDDSPSMLHSRPMVKLHLVIGANSFFLDADDHLDRILPLVERWFQAVMSPVAEHVLANRLNVKSAALERALEGDPTDAQPNP